MQKIISFFLASSITEIHDDRIAVGDFINQLNNIYVSKGVYIKLYKCESDYMDHSMKTGGSQLALDEIIKQSDLCFILFWKRAGELTKHELDLAFQSFVKHNRPKVVVYFKKIPDNESIPEEISNIMRIIDNELLHYHREYEHIDSLKLGIITQLQVNGFIDATIKVDDEIVSVDDFGIISTKQLPLFSDNAEYISLLEKSKRLNNERNRLKEMYEADHNNMKLYRDLSKCTKECERIKEDLDDLTDSILNIGTKLAAITSEGKNITDNMRKAIKLFDQGNYDGVLELLSPDDIDNGLKKLDVLQADITRERICFIEEYRLRILALKAKADWSAIYDSYKKAIVQVIDRPEMPKTIMFEYAYFLYDQKNYKLCIEICNKLQDCLKDNISELSYDKNISLENLQGKAFLCIKDFQNAIAHFETAHDLCKKIAVNNPDKDSYLAESYYNQAKVNYILNHHHLAEYQFNESIKIYDRMQNDNDFCFYKAIARKELAQLYYQTNRHKKAAKLYADSLTELEKTYKSAHSDYKEEIIDICKRLAGLYCAIIRHKITDRYFISALKTKDALISSDKKSFSNFFNEFCSFLIGIYKEKNLCSMATEISELQNQLAIENEDSDNNDDFLIEDYEFYEGRFNMTYIESLCEKALSLSKELAVYNPEAYECTVSDACNLFGEYFIQVNNYDDSEKLLEESLAIQNKLLSFSDNFAKNSIANTHCNLGLLYIQKNDFGKAVSHYNAALEIYREYASKSDGGFDNELARTFFSLGNAYKKAGDYENADIAYFNSIKLYLPLFAKSPRAFIDRIINTVGNIVHLYFPDTEEEKMSLILIED